MEGAFGRDYLLRDEVVQLLKVHFLCLHMFVEVFLQLLQPGIMILKLGWQSVTEPLSVISC